MQESMFESMQDGLPVYTSMATEMAKGMNMIEMSVFETKAVVAVVLSPPNVSAIATTDAAGDIAIEITGARYTYSS